jgi:hypothetical protein
VVFGEKSLRLDQVLVKNPQSKSPKGDKVFGEKSLRLDQYI